MNVTILSDDLLENNSTIWTYDIICLIAMITVLSITGTLGNAPTLIVFLKRKDRHASSTFIKILAVLDLLVCMFVMPFTIFYELHTVTSDVSCRVFEFLSHFTVLASNATLVAIATERYIAVCKIGLKLTVKMINKGTGAIIISSVLISMPSIGVFAVVDMNSIANVSCSFPHDQVDTATCHFTYNILGKEAVTIYQVAQVFIFFAILIIIIVLYTSVYSVLWKRSKIRKHITSNRPKVRSTAVQSVGDDSKYMEMLPINDKSETVVIHSANGNHPETVVMHTANGNHLVERRTSLPSLYIGTLHKNFRRRTLSEPSDLPSSFESGYVTPQAISATAESLIMPQKTSRSKSKPDIDLDKKAALYKAKKRYYHIRTAKMLFLCTVIYLVTWIPFWLDIFGVTNSRTLRYLFFIGHATNPIIYGIVNKQVRVAGKRLFFQCIRSVFNSGPGITDRSDAITTGYFSNERSITNP
ncbi:hypothetical protein ACF0H5_015867 [Mactra antiquata]